jgi:deferrochelatase/peroxidase EfeB
MRWVHDLVAFNRLSVEEPHRRFGRANPAFTYRGGRDITGFVDGTANPPKPERSRPDLA